MKKSISTIIAASLSIMLFGCVSQKETMIKQGFPPVYAEGFQDGCDSGNNAGGSVLDQFKKNIELYNHNSDYRQGWEDGYKQCKAKQDAFQKQYQTTIEQQRMLEEKRHNKKTEEKELLKGIDTSGLENLK